MSVRVAMIGAGGMANSVHYPSLASFEDVEFAGVCDLDEVRLVLGDPEELPVVAHDVCRGRGDREQQVRGHRRRHEQRDTEPSDAHLALRGMVLIIGRSGL